MLSMNEIHNHYRTFAFASIVDKFEELDERFKIPENQLYGKEEKVKNAVIRM